MSEEANIARLFLIVYSCKSHIHPNCVPAIGVEYALFIEEFKKTPGRVWIMKPVGAAQVQNLQFPQTACRALHYCDLNFSAKSQIQQGRGIFLVSKLSQVSEWRKGARWKPDQDPEQKVG